MSRVLGYGLAIYALALGVSGASVWHSVDVTARSYALRDALWSAERELRRVNQDLHEATDPIALAVSPMSNPVLEYRRDEFERVCGMVFGDDLDLELNSALGKTTCKKVVGRELLLCVTPYTPAGEDDGPAGFYSCNREGCQAGWPLGYAP